MRDLPGRILSSPIRLEWAGWETDTNRLQQAGWSLSADQDVYHNSIQLALRHEILGMHGLTEISDFDYYRNAFERPVAYQRLPMRVLGREVHIHAVGRSDWSKFKPIDAQPAWTSARVDRLEDLVHFAPSLVRTQQIILPEESVSDLLERIVKMQEPGREEHFKRMVRESQEEGRIRNAQPLSKVHAQIISLAA